VQGWIQGRTNSFSEEMLQFAVPMADKDTQVVGMVGTPDDALHVLTTRPSNLCVLPMCLVLLWFNSGDVHVGVCVLVCIGCVRVVCNFTTITHMCALTHHAIT